MSSLPAGNRGAASEDRARYYLETQGLKTLNRNFRTRRGEIDLVMLDSDTLVFVEVRYRKGDRYGSAAESVTYTKQQRINSAAKQFLLSRKQWCRHPCRFDVVAISGAEAEHIDWIKDAFRPEG